MGPFDDAVANLQRYPTDTVRTCARIYLVLRAMLLLLSSTVFVLLWLTTILLACG